MVYKSFINTILSKVYIIIITAYSLLVYLNIYYTCSSILVYLKVITIFEVYFKKKFFPNTDITFLLQNMCIDYICIYRYINEYYKFQENKS